MPIDTSQSPDVSVTGIVRAPLADVWAKFRDFGEPIMAWWPIYEWAKLEAPGVDEVGVVRHIKTTTGRTYREKLTSRDDDAHTLAYDMLSIEPSVPTFKGATTRVAMFDQGDGTTRVEWISWSDAGRLLLGQIKSTQSAVYTEAIKSLDRAFHPALGTLTVTVIAGHDLDNGGLFPTSAYVLAALDDDKPERTTTHHLSSHPVYNQDLKLTVMQNHGALRISAWDAHLGRDLQLGAAEVDIHELTAGKRVEHTLQLEGSEGAAGGTLTVALLLELADGDQLELTQDQQNLHHLAVLQGVMSKLQAQVLQLAQQAAKGPEETWGYARYARSPQVPDVPLEELPRAVAGLPPECALAPHKLARMAERGIEYVYSQTGFLNRSEEPGSDPFMAYFGGWLKPPEHVVAHWRDDEELARQFLQGTGPMVIERVTDLARLPESLRGLTLGGETLSELASEDRLFFLDYEPLAALDWYEDMVFYAPYVLVKKNKSTGKLAVAAIQLTRNEGDNAVYTAEHTPPNRWQFAKLHVACADNQMHQWLFHLGYAHLAMEPFVIAWHNALPTDHPVSVLLAPHFHDTLGINFLARQTLVSDIAPFTDRTFSTGTAQALKMFLGAWKKYDFFERAFPTELAARGFDEACTDGLSDYIYRDDGFLIWNALGDYTKGFVEAAYANDAAVASDAALQAWAKESTDPEKADIPGFPSGFADRASLQTALQTLIWAVSAAHSAVNFSQFDNLSYVPNRPDSLFRAMPDGDGEIDASVIEEALPNPLISHFQISFAWLLTLPSEHPLTQVTALHALYPEVHDSFQSALSEISAKLHARNEALVANGEAPYPYLLPENIASSIAI